MIFKTTDPVALLAYEEAITEYQLWTDRILAFAKEVHPDAKPMTSTTWGEHRLGGVSKVDPIPDGWRVDKNKSGYEEYLVPRRSVKEGKAWAKRLDELRQAPNVRSALPGMPTNVFSGLALLNPGIEERDGTLYVIWSEDPRRDKADTGFSKVDAVDESIWEHMKLSEWYAMKEAEKESVDA